MADRGFARAATVAVLRRRQVPAAAPVLSVHDPAFGLDTGSLAAIVLGVVLFVVLVILAVLSWCFFRSSGKRRRGRY